MERYDDAYDQLLKIIRTKTPDAEKFRRVLDEALAGGFPVDFWGSCDGTLLHWTMHRPAAVRAGLARMLIEAGSDVDAESEYGEVPLEEACLKYMHDGAPEYLALINILLEAGARPELGERWTNSCRSGPEEQARAVWLEAYIASWPERHAGSPAPAFDYAL